MKRVFAVAVTAGLLVGVALGAYVGPRLQHCQEEVLTAAAGDETGLQLHVNDLLAGGWTVASSHRAARALYANSYTLRPSACRSSGTVRQALTPAMPRNVPGTRCAATHAFSAPSVIQTR